MRPRHEGWKHPIGLPHSRFAIEGRNACASRHGIKVCAQRFLAVCVLQVFIGRAVWAAFIFKNDDSASALCFHYGFMATPEFVSPWSLRRSNLVPISHGLELVSLRLDAMEFEWPRLTNCLNELFV